MIKYVLGCDKNHSFEAWFRSGDAFDRQAGRQLVVCPECGSTVIAKRPMAPAVLKRAKGKPGRAAQASQLTQSPSMSDIRKLRNEMLAKSENVGEGFAGEARRIHFGEAEERSIHGKATPDDARSLIDDGVPFGLIPVLPEDQN